MTARFKLTPQMLDYEQQFSDGGNIRWLPYLMYFHPAKYSSSIVNTDINGFRYSEKNGSKYSVADHKGIEAVRLLAGSSTVFGIGATADCWTLSSRMSTNDSRPEPWVNFGGRSFNSAQELILLIMYRHLLPKIKEIVLFSGFNNLGLARISPCGNLEQGAFFNCNQFFDALISKKRIEDRKQINKWLFQSKQKNKTEDNIPSVKTQIQLAAELTLRHLDMWRIIANDLGAKLTYVLQPLSGWVRSQGCKEEEMLFAELEQGGRFNELYGDILHKDICFEYAHVLETGAKKIGVKFVNISPILSDSIKKEQWLFVDRIHFTDTGNDFVAKKLLEITL